MADAVSAPYVEDFRRGLRALGYVDGQSMALEWRFAAGDPGRLANLAANLVSHGVDVIVTDGVTAAVAALEAARVTPVIVVSHDATGDQFLARSWRTTPNVTGVATASPGAVARQLALLKAVFPRAARVAFLWSPDGADGASRLRATQAAGRRLRIRVDGVALRPGDDPRAVLQPVADRPPAALLLADDPVLLAHHLPILDFAAGRRLATACAFRGAVEAGCLLSVGPRPGEQYVRAAQLANRILRGARPRDLPVEPPSRLEVAVNLTTAAALGVAIPDRVIATADHVVR